MKILIDNGHGENTPGKRSPDGKLREYLMHARLQNLWNEPCVRKDMM